MLKFIHLTDTHILERGQLLYGSDPVKRLRLAVDSINREHGDAAFVIHTGDMTEWGDKAGFKVFEEEISRLGMPVHLAMGNHDEVNAFSHHFPESRTDNSGYCQSSFSTSYGRFLMLDTHIPHSSAGGYCEARQLWLQNQLAQSDEPIFIAMHHPPLHCHIRDMDAYALKDADALFSVLAPYKDRIRHIFFGHVHRVFFGNWRGISYSCMRGTNHQVALDLSGRPSLIAGNFESPAYGVALIDQDNVTIHMHDFEDRSPRFWLDTEDGNYRHHALNMRHDDFKDIV